MIDWWEALGFGLICLATGGLSGFRFGVDYVRRDMKAFDTPESSTPTGSAAPKPSNAP